MRDVQRPVVIMACPSKDSVLPPRTARRSDRPRRGVAVPGFPRDLTRGDVEDWLADKEGEEKSELRRRANLGVAISLVSTALGLVGWQWRC